VADISAQEGTSLLRKLLRRLTGNSRFMGPRSRSTSEAISGNRCLAIPSEVQASVHDDGLALLHIPSGRVVLGNRTACRIWQGIAEGLSADTISAQISHECGIARELVQKHTSSFLADLERRGLVIRRAGGES
jgi:hypothetical protein